MARGRIVYTKASDVAVFDAASGELVEVRRAYRPNEHSLVVGNKDFRQRKIRKALRESRLVKVREPEG